jgi:hypothetical protein
MNGADGTEMGRGPGVRRGTAIAAVLVLAGTLFTQTSSGYTHSSGSTTAIVVRLTSTPAARTTSRSAEFQWRVAGAETVRCALDRHRSKVCARARYAHLVVGRHTFRLVAFGHGTSKTVQRTWTILSASRRSGTTSPSSHLAAATASAVTAPAPPTTYALPAGTTLVTNSTQLKTALKAAKAKQIVLADGIYDSSTYFSDANGSSLYAQHVGKAILRAGLVVGANWGSGGSVVRGLAFDVSTPSKTFQNSEVNTWGPAGAGTQVLDCTFDGHWSVAVGILAVNPAGLVAQRLQFAHFTDHAIRATNNARVAYGAPTPVIGSLSDISVDGVSRAQAGSSNGTAEAGIFIGHPVRDGVHRIRVRNAAVAGIETANNARDTTFTDLDINMSGPHAAMGVAVYMEHYSLHLIFNGFVITGSQTGFNGEWNDGTPGAAAAQHVTIENGTIDAAGWTIPNKHTVGVFFDEGSDSNTVTGVTFKNQNWAGIGSYKNIGTNSFTGNTFQLLAGAVPISSGHP